MASIKYMLFNISLLINKIGMLANIHSDEFWQTEGASYEFMRDFLVGLDYALLPFMFTLTTVLTLYAIVLGVNMAKAENPADAKKKIVGVISSLIVIIIVIVILKFIVIPNMGAIFSFITQTFS